MDRFVGNVAANVLLVLALVVGSAGHLAAQKRNGGELASVTEHSIAGALETNLALQTGPGEIDCEICASEDGRHGFSGGAIHCTEENREDNPSCRTCGGEEPAGHAGCHGTSEPGLCSTHGGPSCGEGGASLVTLLQDAFTAVAHENPSVLLRLVAESDALYVNRDRQAIQAVNCVGAVVAHIPLGSQHAEALAFFSAFGMHE